MVKRPKQRALIERRIIRRIALDAIAAGYAVSVNDGEATTVDRSTDVKAIIAAVQTAAEDYLLLHRACEDRSGRFESESFAWIKLVYGNEGWDVVNDYTTNIESVMATANIVATRLEQLYG